MTGCRLQVEVDYTVRMQLSCGFWRSISGITSATAREADVRTTDTFRCAVIRQAALAALRLDGVWSPAWTLGRTGQWSYRPPAIWRTAPVTYDASSESNQTIPRAISTGRAIRCIGMRSIIWRLFLPVAEALIAVAVVPGQTAFTRIWRGANSRARPLVKASASVSRYRGYVDDRPSAPLVGHPACGSMGA